ncbi:hypothetical protein EON79_02680 [bacterium]|nr:MAG: hypothetical protein EON79_02680 [bacterium]
MEKTEMTAAWNALQSRVETLAAQQVQVQDTVNRSEMKLHRWKLMRLPIGEITIASLTVLWISNFAASNFGKILATPLAALPMLLLFLMSLVNIHFSVRHLIAANGLDMTKPVVEAQRELAEVRKRRVKLTQWTLIGAVPLWFLFPIVLGQLLFGFEFVNVLRTLARFDRAWVVGNLLLCLAAVPLLAWSFQRSRFAQTLRDDFAGKDLLEAEAFLWEIRAFQKD